MIVLTKQLRRSEVLACHFGSDLKLGMSQASKDQQYRSCINVRHRVLRREFLRRPPMCRLSRMSPALAQAPQRRHGVQILVSALGEHTSKGKEQGVGFCQESCSHSGQQVDKKGCENVVAIHADILGGRLPLGY
ncbi:uncharacterized protein [Asterias amurensis]|uniref:uncharacterized protein n=1 Tax=Asterias amurensis TaxID=7602 RepID=UPI003AB588C2